MFKLQTFITVSDEIKLCNSTGEIFIPLEEAENLHHWLPILISRLKQCKKDVLQEFETSEPKICSLQKGHDGNCQ